VIIILKSERFCCSQFTDGNQTSHRCRSDSAWRPIRCPHHVYDDCICQSTANFWVLPSTSRAAGGRRKVFSSSAQKSMHMQLTT